MDKETQFQLNHLENKNRITALEKAVEQNAILYRAIVDSLKGFNDRIKQNTSDIARIDHARLEKILKPTSWLQRLLKK